jgi:broad specificity phosphatase PhoE
MSSDSEVKSSAAARKSHRIFLIRHGETDWNKEGRIQGRQDIPLNDTGLKQARDIAEFLKVVNLEYIYHSPLQRAVKTAEIIKETIGVDAEEINELAELSLGIEEGNLIEDIKTNYGAEFYAEFSRTEKHMDFGYSEGETKTEALKRFSDAVNHIIKTTKYSNIGIVSHGFVIRLFLIGSGLYSGQHLHNCVVICCEYEDGIIKSIEFLNEKE